MRFGVSGRYQLGLARGAALLLAGGVAAGCSSDVTRFQDSILTGSARTAQPAPVHQPYPGDVAGLDQTHTGSVRGGGLLRSMNVWNRNGNIPRPQGDVQAGAQMAAAAVHNPYPGTATPVHNPYPAPAAPASVTAGPALAPVTGAGLDTTVTGGVTRAVQPAAAPAQPMSLAQPAPTQQPAAAPAQQVPAIVATDGQGGWSRAGGTQVAVREGETVYNLSRRFGVPADAILKANGMTSADQLAAGQQIVIPTYVHSARAPVSAPDANPDVAAARSSTGTRYDVPEDRTPLPTRAPSDRVAVLPQQPKLKEPEPGPQAASADAQKASAATAGGTYTVVAGDTLSGISRKTGVGTEALKQANGLSSGLIRVGQTLTIPAGGSAPAQAAAGVDHAATGTVAAPPAAQTPPQQQQQQAQPTQDAIQQAALDTSADTPGATGISRLRWPVQGRVISGFGSSSGGKKNDGIDIAVPAGTPVRAAENGVVIYAGDGLKEFGNTVLVRHENGLVTVYGHAGEINVQRGQQVRRGDEIAKAGMSGSADSPRLHFEVRKDSAPVDPTTYLE